MPVVEYAPKYFEALCGFVDRLGDRPALIHRPFVDYYYTTQDWCRLYLYVGNDGTILATYGLDRMPFDYNGREMMIGFGSNFYSLQPGLGGVLFIHWHKACPIGLVYGGSADTHRMIRGRKWRFYNGVRMFVLNKPYQAHPGDGWLRVAAKSALRQTRRANLSSYSSRIPADIRARISIREERAFTEDLIPRESPFTFRLAAPAHYLNWRYNTELSFIRYRLFRILNGGRTTGYVVFNESPEKLLVAHCDGMDAQTLAYGVVLGALEACREDRQPRSVTLASCHTAMQEIYQRIGFRSERTDRTFAVGTLGGPVDIEPNTSNWLVNFDWGDNGLRRPFLDESSAQIGTRGNPRR
ncbi:MAG: hypothetical protein WCD43_12350 [Candidatus Acidiferrales bacterium]